MCNRDDDEDLFDRVDDDLVDDDLAYEDGADTEPCPSCGREVYEDADKCPYCGDWIMPGGGGASRSRSGWFIAVIFMVVLGMVILYVLST